jgi:hypothetical protein
MWELCLSCAHDKYATGTVTAFFHSSAYLSLWPPGHSCFSLGSILRQRCLSSSPGKSTLPNFVPNRYIIETSNLQNFQDYKRTVYYIYAFPTSSNADSLSYCLMKSCILLSLNIFHSPERVQWAEYLRCSGFGYQCLSLRKKRIFFLIYHSVFRTFKYFLLYDTAWNPFKDVQLLFNMSGIEAIRLYRSSQVLSAYRYLATVQRYLYEHMSAVRSMYKSSLTPLVLIFQSRLTLWR